MRRSEYSSRANFSRIFYGILIYYKNFLGEQGKEPEFVGMEKIPPLRSNRGDIQISRITC
jgi:hypothetical protein